MAVYSQLYLDRNTCRHGVAIPMSEARQGYKTSQNFCFLIGEETILPVSSSDADGIDCPCIIIF